MNLCIDCKHYKEKAIVFNDIAESELCAVYRSPVNGQTIHTPCRVERQWSAIGCGRDGRLWEAK